MELIWLAARKKREELVDGDWRRLLPFDDLVLERAELRQLAALLERRAMLLDDVPELREAFAREPGDAQRSRPPRRTTLRQVAERRGEVPQRMPRSRDEIAVALVHRDGVRELQDPL